MDKDLLQIKIAKCFDGRDCSIVFDPFDHYGWLAIRCRGCIFPDDLEQLKKLLYISNISASIDCSSLLHLPFIEIYCSYEDVKL